MKFSQNFSAVKMVAIVHTPSFYPLLYRNLGPLLFMMDFSMEYKTLSDAQREELVIYELSKSVEYFMTYIDEIINKHRLLNSPNSAYTKVHLKIRETIAELHFRQSENIIFDKFYPLSTVKQEFSIDVIANLSSIIKPIIKPGAIWGLHFDICFFKSDGTPNGAITDYCINPSAFKAEFLKIKGWEQYIA